MSSPQRQTVAVLGLGNIGAAIAGCLRAANQHDVTACARRPIDSLFLDRNDGTEEVPLRTVTDPAQARPVDWVLLCCKVQDTPSTAPWLARLCTSASHIAVLQNGIGRVAQVAPYTRTRSCRAGRFCGPELRVLARRHIVERASERRLRYPRLA
jgi:2-dehydropantoate 2-reductase